MVEKIINLYNVFVFSGFFALLALIFFNILIFPLISNFYFISQLEKRLKIRFEFKNFYYKGWNITFLSKTFSISAYILMLYLKEKNMFFRYLVYIGDISPKLKLIQITSKEIVYAFFVFAVSWISFFIMLFCYFMILLIDAYK